MGEIVRDALPASLELGITALLVALVLGLAVGFSGVARPEENSISAAGSMASAPMPCRCFGPPW